VDGRRSLSRKNVSPSGCYRKKPEGKRPGKSGNETLVNKRSPRPLTSAPGEEKNYFPPDMKRNRKRCSIREQRRLCEQESEGPGRGGPGIPVPLTGPGERKPQVDPKRNQEIFVASVVADTRHQGEQIVTRCLIGTKKVIKGGMGRGRSAGRPGSPGTRIRGKLLPAFREAKKKRCWVLRV